MSDYTVVLAENKKKYKVCKIVFYSDGGFGVFVPYNNQKEGLLTKYTVDYNYEHEFNIPRNGIEYKADDLVKLSIHYDGFVQFSHVNENNIVSGRSKILKFPKGLGLQSQPLSNPVQTGPTFGVHLWGLSSFKETKSMKKNGMVCFKENDFYFRYCDENNWNGGYLIEGFVFRKDKYWANVKNKHDKLVFTVRANNYLVEPGRIINFKVIHKDNLEYFIALSTCRSNAGFKAESGFTLAGPSEFIPPNFIGEKKAMILQAIYPPPFEMDEEVKSINYIPS